VGVAEQWVLLSRERRDLRRNFAKCHCAPNTEHKQSNRRMLSLPFSHGPLLLLFCASCRIMFYITPITEGTDVAIPKRLPVRYFLLERAVYLRV